MIEDYSLWSLKEFGNNFPQMNLKPFDIIFGNVLKQFRIAANLSQEGLAERAGLDRTFISLLERGKRQPTLTTIIRLADAMEIDPTVLFAEVVKQTKAIK